MKTFNILSCSNWNIFFKSNGLIRNPFEVWQSICSIIVSVFSMIYLDCFHPITWSIFSENSNATLLPPAGIVWNMFQQLVIWGPYCDHDDCEQWCWASSGHGSLVSGAETQNIGHLLVSTHPHHLSCDPPSALNTHSSSDVSSLCCFIVKKYQNCRNFIKNICSILCLEWLTLVVSD